MYTVSFNTHDRLFFEEQAHKMGGKTIEALHREEGQPISMVFAFEDERQGAEYDAWKTSQMDIEEMQ